MSLHHQLILSDLSRPDGHDASGTPGDCWRTCIANVLGLHPSEVPNFVIFLSWMEEARRWLERRGQDYGRLPSVTWLEEQRDAFGPDDWFIVSGPSPRGDWRHCVLMDRDLTLVHDPHPSGEGIVTGDPEALDIECITSHLLMPRPAMPALPAAHQEARRG